MSTQLQGPHPAALVCFSGKSNRYRTMIMIDEGLTLLDGYQNRLSELRRFL
jgi:hypothetical protein